jgi:2-dehydro-3-deoxy-D-arabinonate dehydratase
MLVLDRRDVRHLRRQGRLLTLQVRVAGPAGVEEGRVDGDEVVLAGGRVAAVEPRTLALPDPYTLLRPVEPPEVWCAGVTYERSRDARIEESGSDVYARVYDADRPELFLKDAGCRRTVGPGAPIGVRSDSAWNVPEAEIGLVLGEGGEIAGYTIGNDVSSRDIEGANPLYLPQAKVFAGSCAIGPAVLLTEDQEPVFDIQLRIFDGAGGELFRGATSTSRMKRGFRDLASWLVRDNPVPAGSVLLTGTGVVPPDDFTLAPGHVVEITVPGIGTLRNNVVRAQELILPCKAESTQADSAAQEHSEGSAP